MTILVLQLADNDPPGRLAEWLTDAGAEVRIAHPYREKFDGSLDDYQAVVCLGGQMGANDVIDHPWLADVRSLLATCVTKQTPLLAVCLGAQLLAMAMGGQVETGDNGPEIGPGLIAKRDLAWTDPLFADLPLMPDVVQFHHDTVSRLPNSAVLLASSTRYPHQAFRIGQAYGIQFHIETTPEIVQAWVKADPEGAEQARPGELEPERLAELHADVEEVWRPFAERFVKLARGELTPVEPARPQLPMI